MKKRILCALLALCMVLSLAPSVVHADSTDVDMSEMNALEAIGFDTSKPPDGFNANDTSNPYGRDSVTVNPVDELLLLSGYTKFTNNEASSYQTYIHSELRGHSNGSITDYTTFKSKSMSGDIISSTLDADLYRQAKNLIAPYSYDFQPFGEYTPRSSWAAMAAAAANFDGNQAGQKKQYALVTLEYQTGDTGSKKTYAPVLKLQTLDAGTGAVSSAKAITLISDFSKLGNSDEQLKKKGPNDNVKLQTMEQYDLQNYVKVAAGDFNGDGLDEIAVYVPDADNPRIEVYQYKKTTGATATSYQNMADKWAVVWTYALSKTGKGAVADANGKVPNMVSLLAADINRDGIDDLAVTYGYFHGDISSPKNVQSIQSRAAVLYGSKNNANLLTAYDDFAIQSSDGQPIVRAAFTYGPLVGVDQESLVLGGQSATDLKNGKAYTRYAAVYQYDGEGFGIVTDKNLDLFAKNDDGSYVYSCMERAEEIFCSLPYNPANLAVISNGLTEAATLYFDSLQLTYAETGLELGATLDADMPADSAEANKKWNSNGYYYTEYGAASADLFGYGYDALATILFYPGLVRYTDDATRFNMIITEATPVAASEEEVENGQKFETKPSIKSEPLSTSNTTSHSNAAYFIFPNTDEDTAYLKYNQNHYFIYSNPKVLAVLASSPYFEDLMNRDDLSGAYIQSETSYAKTEGSSDGAVASTSIWAGAYASLEQDITIFGIKIGSIEASSTIKAKFTYEFEMNSTLEQTVAYSTSVGADAVVLYSIPTVVYEYTAYTPDGKGGYNAQAMTITSPHTAAIQVMDLETYEEIAKDYDDLPKIAGNIMTHTLGDPSTYPTSTKGYEDAIVWNGNYAAVGYTDAPNGQNITQTIDMSTEYSHAFVFSSEAEYTAGIGAGCVTVGVVAGGEAGAGYVMTSTSGSSYTASMQNMPIEAKEFGYGFSWKLFAYDGGGFPVVSYLVTDIEMPPELPDDFSTDPEQTTDHSIALTWSYDSMISGFQLYRYYDFPDGSGDYELAFVPFDQGKKNENGTWDFVYHDENLNPYTEYTYKIQAVRGVAPNRSIESEAMTVRTKTDVGYPEIELVGLDVDGALAIYPDSTNTVAVVVKNAEDYPQGISYQWQKLENGNWVDLNNKKQAYYTFLSSGYSSEGDYRCRINVVYYDPVRGEQYFISSYSDVFHAKYRLHKAQLVSDDDWTADVTTDGKPTATVTLQSTTTGHKAAPSGIVSFEITGLNYSRTYNVSLKANGTQSTASLTANMTSALPEGVYTIEAYYQGSRVFSSLDLGQKELLSGSEGYRLIVCDKSGNEIDTVTYGEGWTAKLKKYTKDASGKITATEVDTSGWKYGTKLYRMGGNGSWLRSAEAGDWAGSWEEGDYGFAINEYEYHWAWLAQTPCRSYKLVKTYDNRDYEAYFTVTRRPITVGITAPNGQLTAAQGEVESNLPKLTVTEGSLVYGDKLQYDNEVYTNKDGSKTTKGTNFVDYRVYDTAGKEVTLDNNTAPGSYTVVGYLNPSNIIKMEKDTLYADGYTNPKAADENGEKYGLSGITYGTNYEVTFEPVTYVVTGPSYTLTASVTNTSDQNTAGTLSVLEPETHSYEDLKAGVKFANGTSLVLLAEPYEGYQVKKWTVKTGNTVIKTQEGGNTLFYTMLAEDISVELEYELVTYTLNVVENQNEGSVTMPVGFANGAVVRPGAEYTFTATANAGYTFKYWQYVVGGRIQLVETPTITVTIGHADVYLYPIFERNNYTLTLVGNLQASYKWDHDNDSITDEVDRYVTSGALIPAGTNVTISAAPGYRITGRWYQNDIPFDLAGKTTYSFEITQDTTVKADTELGAYGLTIRSCVYNRYTGDTVLGTIRATSTWIDPETGEPLNTDAFYKANDVPGNTEFTLTAVPARGYVFDYWNSFGIDGNKLDENMKPVVYSTDETIQYVLQGEELLTAYFKDNTSKTVTGTFDGEHGNKVSYRVLDRSGAVVDSGDLTSGTALTVYQGETVEITVTPKTNYMVDKWTVNGQVESGNHSKTRTFENVTGNINFALEFAPQSYYEVQYSVEGTGGTVSATSDGEDFASGNMVGGGSTVVFTAEPATGKMVDKWTVNGEEIKNPIDSSLNDHSNTLTIDALSGNSTTIEVTVSFADIKSYGVSFSNIETVHWTLILDPEPRRNAGGFYEGETVSYTAEPVNGYRITDITGFDSAEQHKDGTWTCTIHAISKDYNSILAPTAPLHDLTVDPALTNGTVTIDEVKSTKETVMDDTTKAAAGETVTVTATPAEGFKLVSITLHNTDDASAPAQTLEGNTFAMPDYNVTVSALFAPTHNPITCNPSTGGTVTANPTAAQVGETVYLKIEADSGFQIDRITAIWMNGETPEELLVINRRFTMPDAPVSVTVSFSEIDDGGDSGSIDGGDSGSIGGGDGGTATSTVTLTFETNGGQAIEPVKVDAGTAVDLANYVTTRTNYVFAGWYSDAELTTKVTEMQLQADTTVYAKWDESTASSSFTDVPDDSFYSDAVEWAVEEGVTNGVGDNQFAPDRTCTRAEIVVLLWRAAGSPEPKGTFSFDDVPAEAYYAKAVYWAVEEGVTNGVGGNQFAPDRTCDRSQIVTFLWRYAGSPEASITCEFEDVPANAFYAKAVNWAVQQGITNGVGGNRFAPTMECTRSQAVTFLYRYEHPEERLKTAEQ